MDWVTMNSNHVEVLTSLFHELDKNGNGALESKEVYELARRFSADGRLLSKATH